MKSELGGLWGSVTVEESWSMSANEVGDKVAVIPMEQSMAGGPVQAQISVLPCDGTYHSTSWGVLAQPVFWTVL